jgi:phasin family protein
MCGALVAFQFSKVPQEAIMAKDEKPSEDLSTVAGQTMEQAREAMENYLNFFQKSMSASPWAGTELNKKVADYAQQNVDTAFEFAQKLTQAKDLQDVVRIQTEFLQTQLKSLTEQAKDLSETTTKATTGAFKGISS